jgi:hypothetical protein
MNNAHGRRNGGHGEWYITEAECCHTVKLEGYNGRGNEKRCGESTSKESEDAKRAFLRHIHSACLRKLFGLVGVG